MKPMMITKAELNELVEAELVMQGRTKLIRWFATHCNEDTGRFDVVAEFMTEAEALEYQAEVGARGYDVEIHAPTK